MKEEKKATRKTGTEQQDASDLRKKAEAKLEKRVLRIEGAEKKNKGYLLHELMTHQIELEMQNEELRVTQEDLELSRARYADLYNFSPVGYFTFDSRGIVREINLTGAQMLGVEAREVTGKPFIRFVSGKDRKAFTGHLRLVLHSEMKQTCEIVLWRNDKTSFPASIESISFGKGHEEARECLTSVIDITERKKSEEEITKLHNCLAERNVALESINREMESFSYSVSHDLKAPLRTISGFGNILIQDYAAHLDAQAKDYLQRMIRASSRMDKLIDAMLFLARLAKNDRNIMDVDLSVLANEISWELKERDNGREVDFIIQKDLHALGDLYLIRTAIRNLFENAWKFTANGAARIEFGSEVGGNETVYFVQDNGIGFDMKYAGKLFKPFQRLHSEQHYAGTGIGLATVARIIRMMGGRIWAEAEAGKGATFFFTLGKKEEASVDTSCR